MRSKARCGQELYRSTPIVIGVLFPCGVFPSGSPRLPATLACLLALLERPACRALSPNEMSCNAAISACEQGKQCEEALRLLQQMAW